MKIFGQPSDYSEMLERIFYGSFGSGLVCTFLLGKASLPIHNFLNSLSIKADVGFLKDIEVLYVIIPLAIVIVAHALKIHDRISDFLRIRFLFDTRYILFPLSQGSGIEFTEKIKKKISKNRTIVMGSLFYRYAGFKNPEIDEQLIRTALDNWGWLWVFLESTVFFTMTTIILKHMNNWFYVEICKFILLIEFILILVLWFACRKSAKRQVEAILTDSNRKNDIYQYFMSL